MSAHYTTVQGGRTEQGFLYGQDAVVLVVWWGCGQSDHSQWALYYFAHNEHRAGYRWRVQVDYYCTYNEGGGGDPPQENEKYKALSIYGLSKTGYKIQERAGTVVRSVLSDPVRMSSTNWLTTFYKVLFWTLYLQNIFVQPPAFEGFVDFSFLCQNGLDPKTHHGWLVLSMVGHYLTIFGFYMQSVFIV